MSRWVVGRLTDAVLDAGAAVLGAMLLRAFSTMSKRRWSWCRISIHAWRRLAMRVMKKLTMVAGLESAGASLIISVAASNASSMKSDGVVDDIRYVEMRVVLVVCVENRQRRQNNNKKF